MPPLKAGDLVAFMTAGAYGATLSSQYNTRPLVAEALVRGDAWAGGTAQAVVRGHDRPGKGAGLDLWWLTVSV